MSDITKEEAIKFNDKMDKMVILGCLLCIVGVILILLDYYNVTNSIVSLVFGWVLGVIGALLIIIPKFQMLDIRIYNLPPTFNYKILDAPDIQVK